ncbi:MAG: YfhO family protein [Eubacteriales bacterium]
MKRILNLEKPFYNCKNKIQACFHENKDLVLMFLIYTVFFVFVFLLGFKVFLFEYGKSFVWYQDAVTQHFPFLYDISQMIKGFMSDPQNGIPLWSWELGFGADIIHSYSYYALGDPLSMAIAAFLPLELIESGYTWMVILRLYIVGASLLLYCKHMSLKIIPSVAGALMYAFSIHMVFWGIRHPFFINGAYILPILYIGIDKILQQKKPYLFILTVAFGAINSFYFFYMNTIAIFLYAIIRFIYFYKDKGKFVKNFFTLFVRTLFYYGLGIMISAVLFFPTVYGFLNTDRGLNYPLSFQPSDIEYMTRIFRNLISFAWDSQISEVTIASIALPGIIFALLFSKKEYAPHKLLFLIYTALLFFPLAHSMFNGFSTPNFRWMYIYVMIIAFLTAVMLNSIQKIKIRGFLILGIGVVMYVLAFFNFEDLQNKYFLVAMLSVAALLIGAILFRIIEMKRESLPHRVKRNKSIITNDLFNVFILLLVSLNLIVNIYGIMGQSRYGGQFEDYNTVTEDYNQDITAKIDEIIEDSSFYRVEYNDVRNNNPVFHNFKSPYIFNSIMNENILDLYLKHNIRTNLYRSGYLGVDHISVLESILGMKYYFVQKGEEYVVPYGFEEYSKEDNIIVYKNSNVLPLGFVYYQGINDSELSSVNDIYKTQVMLDAVIVDDVKSLNIDHYEPDENIEEIPYTIKETDGLEMNGRQINVLKKNAQIIISTDDIVNGELYLAIDNIHYSDPEKQFQINVKTDKGLKFEATKAVSSPYYMDNHNYLINLGYDEQHEKDIIIEFPLAGEYTIDSLHLFRVGMENFNEKMTQLKDTPLEDIQYSNNIVEGNVTLYNRGILFLSIPYSEGWHATVDGQRVETVKVNTSFTGIVLDKGYHEISLKYRTPWLTQSIALTLTGILLFIGLVFLDKRGKVNNAISQKNIH